MAVSHKRWCLDAQLGLVLLVLVVIAATWRDSAAAGFALPQQSAPGVGRAQAGNAAAASDPSTVFFNPAGMTELSRPQASVGVNLVVLRIHFDDRGSTAATPGTGGSAVAYPGNSGGNPADPAFLPNLYLVLPWVEDRVWVGLSFAAPFGLALKYDDDWFGRYDSIKSDLRTIDFSPALAVKINDYLSLGGGINIQYADAELTNALPDPLSLGGPTPETDGLFRVDGDDVSVGFNVGILLKPTSSTRIGLHYRSEMNHTLRSHARVSNLTGPLAAFNTRVDAKADLSLPQIAAIAVTQKVTEGLTLLGGLTWYGWNSFDEIRIRFDDPSMPDAVRRTKYRNTYAIAIGGEYALTSGLTLRGGFQYGRTPTRDGFRDTSLPDGDRYWFGLGATWEVSEQIAIDLGFSHVIFGDGDVDVERTFFEGNPLQTSVRVKGEAQTSADNLSIALSFKF